MAASATRVSSAPAAPRRNVDRTTPATMRTHLNLGIAHFTSDRFERHRLVTFHCRDRPLGCAVALLPASEMRSPLRGPVVSQGRLLLLVLPALTGLLLAQAQ